MSQQPELIIHPEAADEARRARLWYEARSASAARNFALKLEVAIDHILDNPEGWPLIDGPIAATSCSDFRLGSYIDTTLTRTP